MAAAHVDWRQRVAGGLVGLLVGDALGVPYEFKEPKALPPASLIEYEPPAGFLRSHARVPPGTWSDDGAQALVLLDTLLVRGYVDLAHFSRGLVRWESEGFYAVDGKVFDIGIQTSRAIARLKAGGDPATSGPNSERDNGNGSLMRVLACQTQPRCLTTRGSGEQRRMAPAGVDPSCWRSAGRPRCASACRVSWGCGKGLLRISR